MHIAHLTLSSVAEMPAGEPASTLMLLSDHCGHCSQNSLYITRIQFYKFTNLQNHS